MKKYIVIGLVLLAVVAIVLPPLLKKGTENKAGNEDIPAAFVFSENLAVNFGDEVPLEIQINTEDIQTLELLYNDSVFATWSSPKKNLKFLLRASHYGLGTRTIQLVSKLADGSMYNDTRMLRVLSDLEPQKWKIEVENEYPHLTTSFTQGLEFNNSKLYESTGQKGQSLIALVDLKSGSQLKKIGLDANYFGEGISVLGDAIYQLTWQEQKLFVYNKENFQLTKEIPYVGEGWGLCNDGKSLIMSNGTERITFRNPQTFAIQNSLEVYDNNGPVTNLNELEYVDTLIFANVWMTNKIVAFGAKTGRVIAEIDGSDLVARGKGATGDVLNGIAYNKNQKKWYLTGKNWEKMFAVKIVEQPK
jgi:glutamine cyclotransferase